MEILCAYIRENARVVQASGDEPPRATNGVVREDIQMAITVLARRGADNFSPDLTNALLDGINARQVVIGSALLDGSSWKGADLGFSDFRGAITLNGCDFSGADLDGCNFEGATLKQVKFSSDTEIGDSSFVGAQLISINFSAIDLGSCDFSKAQLIGCDFDSKTLSSASFQNSFFANCSFRRSGLFDVDFSGSTNWSQKQFDEALGIRLGESKSMLPKGAAYPKHWIDLSDLPSKFDAWATFEEIHRYWKHAKIMGEEFDTTNLTFE